MQSYWLFTTYEPRGIITYISLFVQQHFRLEIKKWMKMMMKMRESNEHASETITPVF